MGGVLDKRLLIVTGKGGVGKSTVSAALALWHARRGHRVLVCEIHAQERVAPLLGAEPSGEEIRRAAENVFTVNVTPDAAMREYGLMVLRYRTIYNAVFENRLVRYFLRAIPPLGQLTMLGKILYEAKAVQEDGSPRWDHVIVDAPATGHAIQMLRIPSVLLDTVPEGALRMDAAWMRDFLVDPARTSLSIVTLPEEMPVNEAIELDQQVRGVVGMPRGALFVNAMPESRFSAGDGAFFDARAQAAEPLGPAVRAARLQRIRAELATRYAARAQAALDLPTAFLPLVPADIWGRGAVEKVATAIAASPLGSA